MPVGGGAGYIDSGVLCGRMCVCACVRISGKCNSNVVVSVLTRNFNCIYVHILKSCKSFEDFIKTIC